MVLFNIVILFSRCFDFFNVAFLSLHTEIKNPESLLHCITSVGIMPDDVCFKTENKCKIVNSSNEVPIAFTLLWSISVCVKVFPKILQKTKI